MASEPCALGCGRPVNPHDLGTWKEVTGFVGGPRKDSMRLRQDTGRVAHNSCVIKLQDGQAIDQPDLFVEEDPVAPVHGSGRPDKALEELFGGN